MGDKNKFPNLLYHVGYSNILQNPNIFNGSRGTLLLVPPDDQNVTQFSCCMPDQVCYFKLTCDTDFKHSSHIRTCRA